MRSPTHAAPPHRFPSTRRAPHLPPLYRPPMRAARESEADRRCEPDHERLEGPRAPGQCAAGSHAPARPVGPPGLPRPARGNRQRPQCRRRADVRADRSRGRPMTTTRTRWPGRSARGRLRRRGHRLRPVLRGGVDRLAAPVRQRRPGGAGAADRGRRLRAPRLPAGHRPRAAVRLPCRRPLRPLGRAPAQPEQGRRTTDTARAAGTASRRRSSR